jgi:solute:Na+ symporter, SSS family
MLIGTIDIITIFVFFGALMAIAYFYSKKIKNMKDFVLGGKRLPLTIAIGTMMATWLCTFSLAELTFTTGIVAFVSMGSLSHYSKIPMAVWVGPKVQFSDTLTLPELMQKMYDKKTALLAAFLMVFYCTALYGVTGLKIIGATVFGMDPLLFTAVWVVIVIVIALSGGLLSVAVTDFIQMIFMMIAVALALLFAWPAAGGWAGITEVLTAAGKAETHLAAFGNNAKQIQYIMVYFVISFSAYADPTFYQRFSASDSAKSARRALLTCIPLWLGWSFCVSMLGLLGLVMFPEATPGGAYLTVCLTYLPPVLKGIFVCGLIGGFISTLTSYWLLGGTSIARDIYSVAINPNASEKTILTLTRFSVVALGVFTFFLANQFTMMATAWAFMGSIWTSGALAPVVMGLFYRGRISANSGFYSLVLGMVATGLAMYFKSAVVLGIQPLFIGLPVSVIAFIIAGQFGKETVINREGGVIHVA